MKPLNPNRALGGTFLKTKISDSMAEIDTLTTGVESAANVIADPNPIMLHALPWVWIGLGVLIFFLAIWFLFANLKGGKYKFLTSIFKILKKIGLRKPLNKLFPYEVILVKRRGKGCIIDTKERAKFVTEANGIKKFILMNLKKYFLINSEDVHPSTKGTDVFLLYLDSNAITPITLDASVWVPKTSYELENMLSLEMAHREDVWRKNDVWSQYGPILSIVMVGVAAIVTFYLLMHSTIPIFKTAWSQNQVLIDATNKLADALKVASSRIPVVPTPPG